MSDSDPEREKWFAANAMHNWNATVPVGTTIRYYSIACEDDFIETTTRSEAWLLGSGDPVVLIKGRTGGVSIYHCRVGAKDHAPPTPTAAPQRDTE